MFAFAVSTRLYIILEATAPSTEVWNQGFQWETVCFGYFDCYDLTVLGLAMDTNMKATLCEQTLDNAYKAYPMLRGAILHSDRGSQYTSERYRKAINKYGIRQSRNSAGGRCHDNARCESMWARFKEELLYVENLMDGTAIP